LSDSIDQQKGRYDKWIGSKISARDSATPRLVDSWLGALDFDGLEVSQDLLGLHWALGVSTPKNNELAEDGHPTKGGFLPPIELPRRMWGSSDVTFLGRLAVGDCVTHTSHVESVTQKQGRSGALCFVKVGHLWSNSEGPLVKETQNIVYRGTQPVAAPAGTDKGGGQASPVGRHTLKITCTSIHLFRFSALTYNSHRIHYDLPYAVGVEGYAGLVVHGPLQASLLLNFSRQVHGSAPSTFSFRSVSPLIAGAPFTLHADDDLGGLRLWITDANQATTMTAKAGWAAC
jgi:3-methylfumaryl-CoA hydratase